MPLKYRRSAQHTDFTAHHGKNQPGVTAWLDTPADQPFVEAASGHRPDASLPTMAANVMATAAITRDRCGPSQRPAKIAPDRNCATASTDRRGGAFPGRTPRLLPFVNGQA